MANFIQGYELRTLLLGSQVIKLAQALPSEPGSATIYTVAGGSVMVTSLAGHVAAGGLSGTTGAVSVGQTPTVSGTAAVAGIATAGVIGGAVAGTWVSVSHLTTGLPGAIQASILSGTAVAIGRPFIVDAGIITVTTSIAAIVGNIDWYLTYIPVDTGASVS